MITQLEGDKVYIVYPENILIRQQTVEALRVELEIAERDLARFIEGFQEGCSHEQIESVWMDNPRYSDFSDPVRIIKHRICMVCGVVFPKRTGIPQKVCQICGGDMEFERKELRGEDMWTIYVCVECRHAFEGT